MRLLEIQHALWDDAGIAVTEVKLGDPMGWCHPAKVTRLLKWIQNKWPRINDFGLHLHNSGGLVMTCIYAAITTLDKDDQLRLEGTLGGIGGCPYCGNDQATGMVPTKDLVHMLEGMGYRTGVGLTKLVECVYVLEKMLGRMTWGHVSRAGPRPDGAAGLLDINAPFVETLENAQHFCRGPTAYEGGRCLGPSRSAYRERVDQGLPTYEVDGDWPWAQPFFAKAPVKQ